MPLAYHTSRWGRVYCVRNTPRLIVIPGVAHPPIPGVAPFGLTPG